VLTFERFVTGTAAWFLAGASRVSLRVLDVEQVRLVLASDSCALPEGVSPGPEALDWPAILHACESWDLEVHVPATSQLVAAAGEGGRLGRFERRPAADATGSRLEARVDRRRVSGDLQAPDVLFALRRQAEQHPQATFTVVLPPGTRDVGRARAGLP
jgi:hypothetical protein